MPREQVNQQPVANPLGRQQESASRSRQRQQQDDADIDDMGGRVRNQQQPEPRNNNNNNNRSAPNNNKDNNNKDPRAHLHGKNLKFKTQNGAIYEGDFEHGIMHGKGRYDFPNGDSYEGDFVNDRIHGYGTYYYASGDSFEGNWDAGRRSGKGRYNFANDSGSFIGVWSQDKADGEGTLYIPELQKPRYEGEWKNSMRHGRGIQRHPDGSYYDGDWELGREQGMGVCQTTDGNVYCGEWRLGQRDGNGILIEHGKKYAVTYMMDLRTNTSPLNDIKNPPRAHKEVAKYFENWWDYTRGQRVEEGKEAPPRKDWDFSAQFVPRSVYNELITENKSLHEQNDKNSKEYIEMESSMAEADDDKMLKTNNPEDLKKSIRMLLDQRDAQRRRAVIAEQRVSRSRAAGFQGAGDAGEVDSAQQAERFMSGSHNNNNNNNKSVRGRDIAPPPPAPAPPANTEMQAQLTKLEDDMKAKDAKLKEMEKKRFADQNQIEELQQAVNNATMREQQARQEAANAANSQRGGSHRQSVITPRSANDTDEITRVNFELTRAKQDLDNTSTQIAELEKKLKHEKEKHRRASKERDEAKQRLAVREMEAALNERLFRLIGAGQMIIIGVLTAGGALNISEDQKSLISSTPEAEFELDCIYKSDQFQDLEDEYANAVTGVRNGYSCAMLFLGSDETSRNQLINNTIPNALNVLFSAVQQMQSLYEVTVSISYIEVNRQQVTDLFAKDASTPVTIMKDARGTIAFDGAEQLPVQSADEAVERWTSTLDKLGSRRVSNKFLVLWVDAVDRASKATFHGKLLLADICASSGSKASLVETETNHLLSTALTEFASTDAYQHRNEPFLMALNDAIGGPTRSLIFYAAGAERTLSNSTQTTLQNLTDCREKISNFPLQHFETPHALALQKYVSEKAPREMPPRFFPLQQGAA